MELCRPEKVAVQHRVRSRRASSPRSYYTRNVLVADHTKIRRNLKMAVDVDWKGQWVV